MRDIPSREGLRELFADAREAVGATVVGISRRLDPERVAVLYVYAHGVGGFSLPIGDTLEALRPGGDGVREVDRTTIERGRSRAVEAFLLDNGAARVVAMPVRPGSEDARFYAACEDRGALTATESAALEALARRAGLLLEAPLAADQRLSRLVRLEQAAELIPALLRVLDVRDVIDRLSATAQKALTHDLLLLNLFSEDLSTFTVYARSDKGTGVGVVQPNQYPASTIHAWTFSIIDDHRLHPFERHAPSTKLGARASLRFPIRFADRVIGGVAFVSFQPNVYSEADVPIGHRLTEHVASAISHFQLAEQLADQAKRTEEERARATSLELLDELMLTLGRNEELSQLIDRISVIAGKVLPHDAAILGVFLPDGRHLRRYASSRFDTSATPDVVELPEGLRDDFDYQIVDDLSINPTDGMAAAVRVGFRSALRMAVRLDDHVAGVLVFLKSAVHGFRPEDAVVGRRVADRVALCLSHESRFDAMRRADEASERAARLEARVQALTRELDERTGFRRVIGESASWKQVLTQATQVAVTDTTVLLLGESGTGKEVVARFLHRASARKKGPFIALNCAALPEQLLEAELFGYERGAFTGATQSKPGQLEQAAGGTLFLDEVGEMSLPAQAKFLRVLQEREFQRLGGTRTLKSNARIVAATNRDLPKAIANGQFREDLFYRLNVFAIRLPPLRDRRDDVLPLTQAFLTEFGRTFAHPPAGLSREVRDRLLDYHWPGNIRELRNVLERAAILCDGGLITGEHLTLSSSTSVRVPPMPDAPPSVAAASARSAESPVRSGSDGATRDLQSMERAMIEQALQKARFNKSRAAKELGLSRHQLYIRMRRHGLEDRDDPTS